MLRTEPARTASTVTIAAPNNEGAICMRADVLSGPSFSAWEAGPRSAADVKDAAALYERAAALCNAPVLKAEFAADADRCRYLADAM